MRPRPAALTDLPPSPHDEQRSRMIKYSLMMSIRVVCIVVCVVVGILVPGWWLVIPALGAVVLPYVAVVVANAVRRGSGANVERPGGILRRDPR